MLYTVRAYDARVSDGRIWNVPIKEHIETQNQCNLVKKVYFHLHYW